MDEVKSYMEAKLASLGVTKIPEQVQELMVLFKEVADKKIKAIEDMQRPSITINFEARKKVRVRSGGKHKAFAQALQVINAGLPLLLVGPTGSGKTYLAEQLASALKVPFTFNSMSEGISEGMVLGRSLPDPKGVWKFQDSPFTSTFKKGGVHLFDEVDAADPNLMVQINAALSNGMLSIPLAGAAPIKKHENTFIVFAANTWGYGASSEYVGRNALDAATLNRFGVSKLFIDYDADLEIAIAEGYLSKAKVETTSDVVINWAHALREKIRETGLKKVVSTRTIGDTCKLLVAGCEFCKVKEMYFSDWSDDEMHHVPEELRYAA
jgi:MoxR-like ATPase